MRLQFSVLPALFAATLVALVLVGCMAAAPLLMYGMMAGQAAYTGYAVYQISSDSSVEFSIDRKDPNETGLLVIRGAKRMVIYPMRDGTDGQAVDIFREKTNLEVASSTEAIRWLESSKLPALNSMPAAEKASAAAELAKTQKADFAILFETSGHKTNSAFLSLAPTVALQVKTTAVDARTGIVVWSEPQELIVTVRASGGNVSSHELNRLFYQGVSARLMELRTGQKGAAGVATLTPTTPAPGPVESNTKQTPTPRDATSAAVATAVDDARPDPKNRELVRAIQSELKAKGYYRSAVDGLYGEGTRSAITNYQRAMHSQVDGQPSKALLEQLRRP